MHDPRTCAICGENDLRMLDQLRLSGGETAMLCGSHALVLRRLAKTPRTIAELKSFVGERRRSDERRIEGDELGEALTAAFNGERRGSDRRIVTTQKRAS